MTVLTPADLATVDCTAPGCPDGAEPGSDRCRRHRPCKTESCEGFANVTYDRGVYAGLCELVCIPARRERFRKEVSAGRRHVSIATVAPGPKSPGALPRRTPGSSFAIIEDTPAETASPTVPGQQEDGMDLNGDESAVVELSGEFEQETAAAYRDRATAMRIQRDRCDTRARAYDQIADAIEQLAELE